MLPRGVYVPPQARFRYLRHAADTKLMLRLQLAFVKYRRPQSACLRNIYPIEAASECLRFQAGAFHDPVTLLIEKMKQIRYNDVVSVYGASF